MHGFVIGFSWLIAFALLLAVKMARAQSSADVLVTGERIVTPSASPRDANVATSTLRRDRLTSPGTDLADMIRDLPGAEVRQSGGLASPSTLGLRGANPNQTAVIVAGARLEDELTGVADLSLLPHWFTNRVEIFRGTSPFGFDRILPGGVLVLEPRSDGQTQGRFRFETGSFGERAGSVIAAGGDESFSLTAGLRASASDNDYPFVNNEGLLLSGNPGQLTRRTNADFSAQDVWLSAARCGPGVSFETVGNTFEREQGVPTLALIPTRQSRALTRRRLWANRALFPVGGRLELEALFNVLTSSISVRDPLRELDLLAERVDVDTWRSQESLAVQSVPTKRGRWRASLSFEQAALTRLDSPDASLLAKNALSATRNTLRAASSNELDVVGPFGVHAKFVGEASTEQGSADLRRRDTDFLTANAGLHVREPRWESWLNITRAARAPALGELYGISASVHGNPRLQPERSVGFEWGGRFATPGPVRRLWVEAASFVRFASDAIVIVRSSEGYAIPINRQSTRVAGLEFAGGVRLLAPVELESSLTLLDPRQTAPLSAGQAPLLPFQSRLTSNTTLRLRQPMPSPRLGMLIAAAGFAWESSRTADFVGLAVLPAQSSLNLEVGLSSLFDLVDWRWRLANVLDVSRYDFVGYPLPGRSVHTSLEIKW